MLKAILSKLKPFLGTFQLHLDKNIEFDYFIIFKDEKNISWEILNQNWEMELLWEKSSKRVVIFI